MVLWHGSVGLPFFSGTAIASSLMDRQGRKSLLITSFTGMVVSYYSIQKYCICLRTFYLCIVLIGYELTINVVSLTSNGCALWFFRFMFLVALWNTNVAEVTLILNFIITDSILLDSGSFEGCFNVASFLVLHLEGSGTIFWHPRCSWHSAVS